MTKILGLYETKDTIHVYKVINKYLNVDIGLSIWRNCIPIQIKFESIKPNWLPRNLIRTFYKKIYRITHDYKWQLPLKPNVTAFALILNIQNAYLQGYYHTNQYCFVFRVCENDIKIKLVWKVQSLLSYFDIIYFGTSVQFHWQHFYKKM